MSGSTDDNAPVPEPAGTPGEESAVDEFHETTSDAPATDALPTGVTRPAATPSGAPGRGEAEETGTREVVIHALGSGEAGCDVPASGEGGIHVPESEEDGAHTDASGAGVLASGVGEDPTGVPGTGEPPAAAEKGVFEGHISTAGVPPGGRTGPVAATDHPASTPGDGTVEPGEDAEIAGGEPGDRPAQSPRARDRGRSPGDFAPDSAASYDDSDIGLWNDPAGERSFESGGESHTGLDTRPCAYCGRPVPQGGDASPAVRFCLDNDGACARAAAERRRRDQDDPGLSGQVARTWDMVERLEDIAELLAMSLTSGLSVAGVERRVADARAEAAAAIARARRDREDARLEAERALGRIGAAGDRTRRAETEAAELRARLASARMERDAAREMAAQATRIAEAANAAIIPIREERDGLSRRIAELTAALDEARERLAQTGWSGSSPGDWQSRLRDAESELERMRAIVEAEQNSRIAAENARGEADRQALEARSHAEGVSMARDELAAELAECRTELEAANGSLRNGERLAAELEESHSRLLEQQLQSRERARIVDRLRGTLAAMISERDAARAEAEEARTTVERLLRGRLGQAPDPRHTHRGELDIGAIETTPPPGPFPAVPPGHDLGGAAAPPDLFRRWHPPAEE